MNSGKASRSCVCPDLCTASEPGGETLRVSDMGVSEIRGTLLGGGGGGGVPLRGLCSSWNIEGVGNTRIEEGLA